MLAYFSGEDKTIVTVSVDRCISYGFLYNGHIVSFWQKRVDATSEHFVIIAFEVDKTAATPKVFGYIWFSSLPPQTYWTPFPCLFKWFQRVQKCRRVDCLLHASSLIIVIVLMWCFADCAHVISTCIWQMHVSVLYYIAHMKPILDFIDCFTNGAFSTELYSRSVRLNMTSRNETSLAQL